MMKKIRVISLGILIGALGGCAKSQLKPDYAHQLDPGAPALRLVTTPAEMPDLLAAYDGADEALHESIEQSIKWFKAPSSKQFFPVQGITHEQAQASLLAFRELLNSAGSASAFDEQIQRRFNVYESVGYDGNGTVLFTGYYAPIFKGSLSRSGPYQYPLYKRPADLATDPKTGEPRGRVLADGSTAPYATRREIESTGMLAGSELVWLDDQLAAYLVHVNGSARIRLDDGSSIYVGYAGKTDRPYASLGKALAEAGLVDKDAVSLSAIKAAYRKNPQKVVDLMKVNESYVFFTEYRGETWPAGSLGVRVTPQRSVATDKKIFPRGSLVVVNTAVQTISRGAQKVSQLALDQDTGGAIRAPGRADLFMGIGPTAEILAGGQYAEGKLYYLFLKPQFVAQYSQKPPPAG